MFYKYFPLLKTSLRIIRTAIYWLPISLGFVYLFAMKKGAITNWLSKNKPINYIGKISPSLYLIHFIVIEFLRGFIPNIMVLTVVSLVMSIVGAWVWLWLEKKVRTLVVKK